MNTINLNMLGGQKYPLVSMLGANWSLTTYKLGEEADELFMESAIEDGLTWVKDDQVNVLSVGGYTPEQIIEALHWNISFAKGPVTASKRISRILRPYRYGYEGKVSDITIFEDSSLNGDIWDGIFQVSRSFVMKCCQYLTGITDKKKRIFESELENGMRWELTILTSKGEYKGHAEVAELPEDVDVRCPIGVAKKELKFTDDSLFIGLNAVHGAASMKLDIQSMINLLPFFGVPNLVKWLGESTKEVLRAIRDDDPNALANMLYVLDSAEAVNNLEYWPAGSYIVSGGNVKWFSRSVMTAASQYREQLRSQADNVRFPIPGGGLYIAPASVGNHNIERGNAFLDFETASIYINDLDWPAYAARNGGFDGDDRHWVVTFNDEADGVQKVLFWRSPNQYGEYLLCNIEQGSDVTKWFDGTIPTLDSRNLPIPIEQQGNTYGTVETISNGDSDNNAGYDRAVLLGAIAQIKSNQGILGGFCNVCLCYVSILGAGPHAYPAKLEAVIDFTVKELGDLSQVRRWIYETAEELAQYPVPAILAHRLAGIAVDDLVFTEGHDLDILMDAMTSTIERFMFDAQQIAQTAMPPANIFDLGREFMNKAMGIKSVYGKFMRNAIQSHGVPTKIDMEQAEILVKSKLAEYAAEEHISIMYGLAALIYTDRHEDSPIRDGVIWNALGNKFLEALRVNGFIGDVEWTGRKAELWYNSPQLPTPKPLSMSLKQVWYQIYVAHTGQKPAMGQISKTAQKMYKGYARAFIPQMIGMKLELRDSDTLADRQVFIGPKGNEVAYLAANQIYPNGFYSIISATEDDGNYHAVLVPVGNG